MKVALLYPLYVHFFFTNCSKASAAEHHRQTITLRFHSSSRTSSGGQPEQYNPILSVSISATVVKKDVVSAQRSEQSNLNTPSPYISGAAKIGVPHKGQTHD